MNRPAFNNADPRAAAFAAPAVAYAAPAQPKSSTSDTVAVWLLGGLVLAAFLGLGGWALGHFKSPSWDDVSRAQDFARTKGQLNGQHSAFRQGLGNGRREGSLMNQYQAIKDKPKAYSNGYRSGVTAGRNANAASSQLGYSTPTNSYDSSYAPYADTSGFDPYGSSSLDYSSSPYYGYAGGSRGGNVSPAYTSSPLDY